MDKVIWLARYEGFFRMICQGIRLGDPQCIRQAAKFFDAMLPDGAIVIPMPSHKGRADQMLKVANEIKRLREDILIEDALRCVPHQSNYEQKKDRMVPQPISMVFDEFIHPAANKHEEPRKMFVIDNVIVSGTTAQAASSVAHCPVLCLCKDMWR